MAVSRTFVEVVPLEAVVGFDVTGGTPAEGKLKFDAEGVVEEKLVIIVVPIHQIER